MRYALDYLKTIPPEAAARIQTKLPCWSEEEAWTTREKPNLIGHYVTELMIQKANDTQPIRYYFKEYPYHDREASIYTGTSEKDRVFALMLLKKEVVEERDQKKPPSKELLDVLSAKYQEYKEWEVQTGPMNVKILIYPEFNGTHELKRVRALFNVIDQVALLNDAGLTHSDLLPRNFVFDKDEDKGYLIDFDFSGRHNKDTYLKGYNYNDFSSIRHPDARGRRKMKTEHDVHSLKVLVKEYLDLTAEQVEKMEKAKSAREIHNMFKDLPDDELPPIKNAWGWPDATPNTVPSKNVATNS